MSAFAAMLAAAIGAGVVMPFAGIHVVALVLWPIRSAVEPLAGLGRDDDDFHPFNEISARVYLGLACGTSVFAAILFASRTWPAVLRPAWPVAIAPGGVAGAGIAAAIWG
jgi:hypothetical protein